MKISTKGRYGLRAMVDIAANSKEGPIAVKEIAKRQSISDNYLEQIIFPLKKAGLVVSVRGAQGGYFLARPAGEITAGDVLRALEGDLAPVDCLSVGALPCGQEESCYTQPLWRKLRDAINEVVDSFSIQDLADNAKDAAKLDFGQGI